ncbi:hypothetical protein PROFUN_05378 [Planoprotostelium fungivorum]|uniref:Uncharacterized protein n=1 Tax=Planoprotostelium fungivorum TaxID=1890364 RepID=A0A2P6NR71_9EUKA|nr:hypothetical protein PROFUN_05378 [Planoprotostelium fungivorum]
MQTSHRIMEAHEIQDLILGFVFGDDQRKPSYTRQRCGCKMTAGITWHRAQIDDAIRKTVERVRAHKCKSLDRLRAWKNIRQCSSRLKHVADRLYTFDAFHYLDAVFRSDPSAVRFFLARHEIDANIPIALLYSCWRGDEMMAELLLSNGRVTVWRSSIIHFDPWVVSTSMRMKKILDRHVPLTKKGLCQNCYSL